MTPTDHNSLPAVESNVSIERQYLPLDYDPDLYEYDNAGDAFVISEARDE